MSSPLEMSSFGDVNVPSNNKYVVAVTGAIISWPYPSTLSLFDLLDLEIPLVYRFCILVPNKNILAVSKYSAKACKSVTVCGIILKPKVFKYNPDAVCAYFPGYVPIPI